MDKRTFDPSYKPSTTRVMIWNAAGSFVNAAASFMFLALVTNVLGSDAGGQWSICFAIAQLMWCIGLFEATNYYATDANNMFSAEQYFAFKVVSCSLMFIVSIGYIWTFHFDAAEALLAFLLCLLKLIDAFGGFWYGTFQKNNRLDLSGYSLFAQMVVTLLVFAVAIVISKNMLVATACAIVAEAAWVFVYNPMRQRQLCPMDKPDFDPRKLAQLFVQLLPVFLASLLSNYLVNMPKYAIQDFGTNDMQAVFGVIFMPSFVINLLTIFILRPTLTPLAEAWARRDLATFYKKTARILVYIFAAAAVVMVCAWFIGIPVLELVFGIDLDNCREALIMTLLGGTLLALANVFYNAIVIIRKQKWIIFIYLAALAVGFLAQHPLIEGYGILGASTLYAVITGTLLVLYIALVVICAAKYGRPEKDRA